MSADRAPAAGAPARTYAVLAALALAVGTGCTYLKRFSYEGWGRDRWQQPERVIATLALQPGMRVADLGAGGGYFTFRLADAVGPSGIVYAVDVDDGLLEYVRARAAETGYANVVAVRAAPDDASVPARVDLLFTCNTYHHLEDRVRYLAGVRRYIRPGGRIAVIDHDGRGGLLARWFGHATEASVMRRELEAAGYRVDQEHEFLSSQAFVVASAP
jgi:predicted methyltransferase